MGVKNMSDEWEGKVIGELGTLTVADVRRALEGVPDDVILNSTCDDRLVFDGARRSLPIGARVKLVSMPPPRESGAERLIRVGDEGVVTCHSGSDLAAVRFDRNAVEVWLYSSNVEILT